MYLYRALNNLDILANPLDNGIASKQMIYKIVKNYYDKNNIEEYNSLSEEEKDKYIKEHMEEYVKNHNSKIKNKYYKYSNQSREDVKEFCKLNRSIKSRTPQENEELIKERKIDFSSYIEVMKYLSTLQQHLLYGSSKDTDWISFSTNFNSTIRYYNNQDNHKIAIVRSNTGGLVDSDNILSVDLSTFEKIKEKSYLCNKIDMSEDIIDLISQLSTLDPSIAAGFHEAYVNKTSPNSRGFKYASNSKEVCIFKYVPKDHIVAVLDALQVDLIRSNGFNSEFLKLNHEEQKKQLEILKKALEFEVLRQEDPFMKHVFEELYINNNNINSLINFQDSEEKIKKSRNKVLYLARNIPNIQIKR